MCILFGKQENCCVEEIEKDKNNENKITKLLVSIYNEAGLISPYSSKYTITEKDILSMLITEEGYKIQRLL
jgi:hypothetical protein